MVATLVPIIITEDWTRPDGTTPTGRVRFDLLEPITSPQYVSPNTIDTALTFGAIAQQLDANDFDSLGDPIVPSTTQYEVSIDIDGAPLRQFFITVPAVPPGSRTITDGVLTAASQTLTSLTADFTADDLLSYVLLPNYPPGTQIIDVISGTAVALSSQSPVNATNVKVMIGAQATLSELDPGN
jgi:hypothetical protein